MATMELRRVIEAMNGGRASKLRALAHRGQATKATRARRAANRVAELSRLRNAR